MLRLSVTRCAACPLVSLVSGGTCSAVNRELPFSVASMPEAVPDWCPAKSGVVVRLIRRTAPRTAAVPWCLECHSSPCNCDPDPGACDDGDLSEMEILGVVGDR